MRRSFFYAAICLFACSAQAQTNYNTFVNPFIGTGGHGHTFPGAVLPFGMVQLGPDTRVDGSWDGCSGYHYSDDFIYGFSHTHLSGTGCSDFGDILVMPTVGAPSFNNKDYGSKFSHTKEKASPGFYEVFLEDDKVNAEFTVTDRVGVHRYSFPKTTEANLILDLRHRDKTLNYGMRVMDSVTVIGFRVSEAWAKKQHVYFVMKFSKPFSRVLYGVQGAFQAQLTKMSGAPQGGCFTFNTTDGKPLLVKVAISTTGVEGALKNLQAEGTHWDFASYKNKAEETWNKQLKKIEVSDPDKDKMTTFYTALYHCCIHPSLNMDVDGRYRGRDDQLHVANGFTNYSVFSLWDTYRAQNPLLGILEPKRTSDFINTFLVQYQQSGRLPVWELAGNETDCMIGFHSVPVIADAMLKGIGGFDVNLAYNAMKAASNYTGFGIPAFNKNGFLQLEDESESVSRSLEYAYDNWCISQVAKFLNKKEEMPLYLKRAQAYKNLFDPSTGHMRPRKNGNWLSPFYPSEINNHFTEGNSWHYSFYVPQDVEGLIKLHGGKENFEKKLDELFTTSEKNRGRDQADVTGLIGQYAHGNEPSHHMAYLYCYIGKPQKTIGRVNQICREFYKNAPDGLIGNEDCGQMSAWYVFSALGFYPVCPGSTSYVVGHPYFNSIKLNLDNGKSFNITADASLSRPVTAITVNGEITRSATLEHSFVVNGGQLVFNYDAAKEPYGSKGIVSQIKPATLLAAPLIISGSQVFRDQLEISIAPVNAGAAQCYYTTDGTEPTVKSTLYKAPFKIDKNTKVKAKAFSEGESSTTTTADFFKIKYPYEITILSKPDAQYSAEGAQSMIDGIVADENWRKGNWLGFQGQDFECVIDLKAEKPVSYISLNFLQDSRSWILFPTSVQFYGSSDNTNFTLLDSAPEQVRPQDQTVRVYTFGKELAQKPTVRYVKIVAKNFGKLPEWHIGKGGDAHLFVDELEIR